MRAREGFCKECKKKTSNSKSGYCKNHTNRIGKYKRTKELNDKMSIIQKTSPIQAIYHKSRQGVKRPEHSMFLKKWWKDRPEEREKARQRGNLMVQNKEYLDKLSMLLSGENNPNWRGGLHQKKYKNFYQKIKDKIRERDNFTCQLCGITEEQLNYRLSVNHIDFNKENSVEQNLNALCKSCNSSINFDREKWTKHFQAKITSIYEKKQTTIS